MDHEDGDGCTIYNRNDTVQAPDGSEVFADEMAEGGYLFDGCGDCWWYIVEFAEVGHDIHMTLEEAEPDI